MPVRVVAACRPLGLATVVVVALLCLSGAAFAAPSAVAPTSDEVVLERGDSGPAVKRLQKRLRITPADGEFGRATERAVRRFQRRRGLTADGVVGPQTRRALGLRARHQHGAPRPRDETAVRLPRVLRRIAKCESGGDPTVVSPGRPLPRQVPVHALDLAGARRQRRPRRRLRGHAGPDRAEAVPAQRHHALAELRLAS